MGAIWLGSWWAQSVTGWSDYSTEQLAHGEPRVGHGQFLGSAHFWESTLQNWQPEFLAVGSISLPAPARLAAFDHRDGGLSAGWRMSRVPWNFDGGPMLIRLR